MPGFAQFVNSILAGCVRRPDEFTPVLESSTLTGRDTFPLKPAALYLIPVP